MLGCAPCWTCWRTGGREGWAEELLLQTHPVGLESENDLSFLADPRACITSRPCRRCWLSWQVENGGQSWCTLATVQHPPGSSPSNNSRRWPELEDEGAQAQALPPQPNLIHLIHQTVSPIRRPVSSAQERTPAAPAARQHAPGSARQHWAPRSRSQQAQRSPAASSPPPVRWRSARALDVRPSPTRRPAHSNASPAPGPTAAAFGSPTEVDQSATAPASPLYVSEAAVPTGTAPTQSAAEPQAPPTAGAGAQAEHSPGPSAGGGGASTISPAPSTAARAGSARRVHQAGMSAGENSTTPAAAGTAAGQATRGRQAQQLAQNTGLAVPAAATGTGRSRGSITGRRSLSAPGVARNHTALPRWQH